MKRNVDLTENRIFVKPGQFFPIRFTPTLSGSSTTSTGTWLEAGNWTNWINNGFIRQGNGKERKAQEMAEEFMAGNTCDRCGKTIFPYNKETLCPKCIEDLSDEYINLHNFYKEDYR